MVSSRIILNLFHLLLVVPFLAFIGYRGNDAPDSAFHMLMAVGLLVIVYHAYRYLAVTHAPLNAGHVILGLFLLYVGYAHAGLPKSVFTIVTLLAILALIVHGYLLATRLMATGLDSSY